MGTREAILALRLILEKRIRKDKSTFIVFVDIEKAFDKVNWEITFEIMKRAEIATTERKLLYQLYKNKITIIKIDDIQKESKIKKGVRQGCTLSPLIFNAYIQEAIDTIRERIKLGIKVNSYRIDILKSADDISIIAENENDLKKILETMEQVMEKDLHMKINTKKTRAPFGGSRMCTRTP
jgi:ACT domain-containing protein|uniref:Retrovirus-related Pol polyprotein LINE-1 n=1 Tax=Sipha flava TaxID=143950 RepID=A0A2S2R9T8_9HEMI